MAQDPFGAFAEGLTGGFQTGMNLLRFQQQREETQRAIKLQEQKIQQAQEARTFDQLQTAIGLMSPDKSRIQNNIGLQLAKNLAANSPEIQQMVGPDFDFDSLQITPEAMKEFHRKGQKNIDMLLSGKIDKSEFQSTLTSLIMDVGAQSMEGKSLAKRGQEALKEFGQQVPVQDLRRGETIMVSPQEAQRMNLADPEGVLTVEEQQVPVRDLRRGETLMVSPQEAQRMNLADPEGVLTVEEQKREAGIQRELDLAQALIDRGIKLSAKEQAVLKTSRLEISPDGSFILTEGPQDPLADDKKTLRDFKQQEVTTKNIARMGNRILDLAGTDSSFLGLVGGMTSFADTVKEQVKSGVSLLGTDLTGEIDGKQVAISKVLDENLYDLPVLDKLGAKAEQRGRLKNLILSVAFLDAQVKNPDGRISDADVRNSLDAIGGKSGSVNTLRGAIKEMIFNAEESLRIKKESIFGTQVPDPIDKKPPTVKPLTDAEKKELEQLRKLRDARGGN